MYFWTNYLCGKMFAMRQLVSIKDNIVRLKMGHTGFVVVVAAAVRTIYVLPGDYVSKSKNCCCAVNNHDHACEICSVIN